MELILNKNPLWTEQHLKHMKRYADSYGGFEAEYFEIELNNIANGKPRLRCNINQSCYEIHAEHVHVGDFVVNDENEIHIVIFDEFSGRKYASLAITMFLEEHYNWKDPLEAVIRGDNKYKDKIQKVLRNTGFTLQDICENGTEIWIYKNG